MSRLRGLRSDLIDPAIAAHHGRTVKRTGDGGLIEFARAAHKKEGAMDPILLATITSAITLIGSEVAKGAASKAGETLWAKIKSMLGFGHDPSPTDLAPEIARKLAADPELAKKIVELLQAHPESSQQASALVQSIDAEKVIVAGEFKVSGNFNM